MNKPRTSVSAVFFDAIESRVSCREFIPNAPIPADIRQTILRAAIRAPTAGNLQAWKVYIVDPPGLPELRAAARDQEWISTASFAMIFFADLEASALKYRKRGRKLYAMQDATNACSYAQLSCQFLGLGACWVGAFGEDEVRQLAGVHSADMVPVSLLIIGRQSPAARTKPRSRKPIPEMLLMGHGDVSMEDSEEAP